MSDLKSEFLFEMKAEVAPALAVGATPSGDRRIIRATGGTFEGPRLRGTVVPGGGDWLLRRPDGVAQLDVRITLQTHDEHLIYVQYRGLLVAPAEVLRRMQTGESVAPSEYYFRITPVFETGSEKYAWLNSIVAVGVGERLPAGPCYKVYTIL